ncbi:hypothetical protein HT102_05465 [Hoyosella sp. G463]|uniref:Uncharacterized protein n=1 Tax=Lolliginicoccus lacisalsi TaxID=2742202 RepID=A0A927JAY0_9ACTN|nr:hypothetical protein [Lolliginicoccus lacisalsi]MBD8505929.1 hypothetical protein [Lolliginicoccus lacisalsi]
MTHDPSPPPPDRDPWKAPPPRAKSPGSPGKPRRKPSGKRRVPPHDVVTAYHLWLVIILLGALAIPFRMARMAQDLDTLAEQLLEQTEQQSADIELTLEQARVLAGVTIGILGLALLLLLGIILLAARAMLRGKQWGRVGLSALAIVLVVLAIPVFFVSSGEGILLFIDSGITVVQAVFGVGAIIAMHRGESTRYFLGEDIHD